MLSNTWQRIALSYAAIVLFTAGILAFFLGGEFEGREADNLRARLGDQARTVAYSAAPMLSANAPVTATNSLAHNLAAILGTRITIIKPNGQVVGDSEQDPALMENHADRPEVRQVLEAPGTLGSDSRLSATVHQRLLYVAVAVSDPAFSPRIVGVARVAYPMTAVEQARDALWRNLALAVLLVTLPAVLLAVLLARSIVGPLSALRQVAYRFGRGDLSARSHLNTGGEIGDLSSEFNAMADQLGTTITLRTAERNQMAAVLAHMHDGVIITDAQGRVQSINPAAALLFSTPPAQALGRSLIEVSHSHELHQALVATMSAPSERRRVETDVDRYNIAAIMTAVPNSDGSNNCLVVLQNITELRRLERARRDFVANISHELRTPLASIKLLVETLHTAISDDPEMARDFLGRIDVELDGLTQLVRELLELSKVESGQVQLERKPVNVPELLERVATRLRTQAERAGLTLTVHIDDGLPQADADPNRIEQVLVNLAHNAIKFTLPSGHVSLSAEARGDELLISVADTGIGISREDLPRIFERFYKVDKARTTAREREREGGTGLGLAIAKHIIQAHGGQIWAESRLNQGTTFFFMLPKA